MAEDEMEAEFEESSSTAIPFQLQFDKPIASQVKIAEWNPEKDLLAMVTEDSKVLLHRFNWQRLWTISTGKCVTSLCWRPDGKTIALGLEDGSTSLHDVENGKLLRSIKLHSVAVTCLNWEEDAELKKDESDILPYEDRTMRFFPPSPRIPRMPGVVSGDNGLMDDAEDSYQDLSNSSHQRFNILCSGDKDGCICFSIFGIFPIGKINIHELPVSTAFLDNQITYHLSNASIDKPAVEIIGFRVGELRGLSRWRARYQIIGLNEKLINDATEKAGMFMVQVERFLRVLAIVMYQFQNFFNWLFKCIRILLSEPTDQIQPPNSEIVVIFLKFLLDHDPVGQLLELYGVILNIDVDIDTVQRVEQLVAFGGFSDTKYLERTLAKEFIQLEECFKDAFSMPFSTISMKIHCQDFLPLYPAFPPSFSSLDSPTSVSFYKGNIHTASNTHISQHNLTDYMCFKIPDGSLDMINCIGILRGFACNSNSIQKGVSSLEAVLLCIPEGYHCVDLSLYKDTQVVLLLNEASSPVESPGRSWMMMIQTGDLSFASVSRPAFANLWRLDELKDLAIDLHLDDGKVRSISHSVSKPLAVSASRGVACVFSSRRHALVYILDEDEEEASDAE